MAVAHLARTGSWWTGPPKHQPDENFKQIADEQSEVVESVIYLITTMVLLPHMCSWDMIQSKRAT